MPKSNLLDASFHSLEEVNKMSRAIGQEGEFRQLGKGRITSRWRRLEQGPFSLISHRLDKRVHAYLAPPKGYVFFAIMPPTAFMWVNGVKLGKDQVLVIDSNSKTDFVTPDEAQCHTFTVPRAAFLASARALFPWMHENGGLTRILQCPSSEWSALHCEVSQALRSSSMSPEDCSHLLSRFLGLMTEAPGKRREELCLDNRSAVRVAKHAQEYIEDRYSETIRLEELCRYTGVSLRTLQRSFSEYFQVSPFEYIKARRLHAVRQALVPGDPSRDRVTQISLENGFAHLGRFSVDYREHFGELPRQTLASPPPLLQVKAAENNHQKSADL